MFNDNVNLSRHNSPQGHRSTGTSHSRIPRDPRIVLYLTNVICKIYLAFFYLLPLVDFD